MVDRHHAENKNDKSLGSITNIYSNSAAEHTKTGAIHPVLIFDTSKKSVLR